MDNPFEMTTDVNGKPIPRWQERLEGMYNDGVPFGEMLSLVRYLLEERDISAILSAPDDVILADFERRGGNIEEYAAEMREKFDTIARLVRWKTQWKAAAKWWREEAGRRGLVVEAAREAVSHDCEEPNWILTKALEDYDANV